MKTNQIMVRNYQVLQRTSDSYFNATELLKIYNSTADNIKLMAQYLKLKSTTDFAEYLEKNKECDGKAISSSRKGTWLHPKVFIDFCMWLSMEFKSIAIDMVLDGLIKSRHDAGDYYNEMTKTILEVYVDFYKTKPPAHIYIEEANMLKSLVCSKDRNNMTENELKQLTYLQKFNTMLIKKRIGKKSRIKQLIQAAEVII